MKDSKMAATHCVNSTLSLLFIFLVANTSAKVQEWDSSLFSPAKLDVTLDRMDGVPLYAPDCQEWNADNRLECWLWELQVDIPAESFSADWITVSIKGMKCTHFVLKDLRSDYPAPHSIEVSVRTLQATCQGKYHASGGISGKVEASVSTKSSLDALQVAFRVLPSTVYPLLRPFTFQTTQCQTQLQATKIHFSGSMSAKLIQVFSKMIGHYITQALQDQLCPLLPKELDPLVTDYLHQLDAWMKPYLAAKIAYQNATQNLAMSRRLAIAGSEQAPLISHRGSAIPVPSSEIKLSRPHMATNSTIYNPLDSNFILWTLGLFNSELANHLQQGWFFNANNTKKYCPHRCQDMFRGLSGWFQSIVGPQMTLPLPAYFHNLSLPPLPLQANLTIGFESISIHGLDELDHLQLLRPIPSRESNSSRNSVEAWLATMNGIHMDLPMVLNIQMENSNHALREPFTLKVNITQLETVLRTSLQVIDWDRITLLQVVNAVQQFVEHPTPDNIRPLLGCLVHTIYQVDNTDWITSLILDSISILRRTTRLLNQSDTLEDDLDHVINTALKLLVGEYSELWTTLIQGLIQDPARHSLSHFIDNWISRHSTSQACPSILPPSQPKWLNFSKFLILDHFNDFLNRPMTLHTMNQYMECVGKFLEGYVAARKNAKVAELSSRHTLLEIVRVEAKHWNAIQHVQLLQPTDDTILESSIQWGNNVSVPQLEVTVHVATEQLSGTVNLTLFAGLQARVGTKIDYNLNRLENLTVTHLLERVECAMVPTYEVRLLPKVTGADLGPQVGLNVSAVLNNQSIYYSTSENKDNILAINGSVADIAATAMTWSVEWIRNIANKALEDWLVRSSNICSDIPSHDRQPNEDDHDDNHMWYNFPLIWIMIVVVVLGQGGVLGVVKQREGCDETDENIDQVQVQLIAPLLSHQQEDEILDPVPLENDIDDHGRDMRELDRSLLIDMRNESGEVVDPTTTIILEEKCNFSDDCTENLKPLVLTPSVPEIFRFAIPMLIIGTVVLLFSSNVSVGASVDMSIRVGETSIQLPGLFAFSLGNTISELYGARIYPLLFLVVVFSGIWPYAKLIWMLYIWSASYGDNHRREQRLLTLDALSKFSLVDTYVLVVMLVAFRFHLDVSDELGLDVYVTPQYGFYAFLMATCCSLVLGHGMLYFHRKVERSKHRSEIHAEVIEKKSIFDHAFDVEDIGPRRPLSRFFRAIVLFSCIAAIVFLLLGFGQKSFSFEFGGLAGMSLGESKTTSYSLVSLGAAIPRSVEHSYNIGVVFLQIAYYFYAIVTPVVCLTILLILLLYPTTPLIQQRLLVTAEISNAWSAVEVFVLSIVAALFQISTFASFIIGDKCDLINKVAATLIGGNIIPSDDAVCFRVVASVESNSWYLFVGVLLNSFVASLVLKLGHATVHERAGHLNKDTLTRQLFGLPIGILFFGAGIDDDAPQLDNEEEEREDAPDWRFWF